MSCPSNNERTALIVSWTASQSSVTWRAALQVTGVNGFTAARFHAGLFALQTVAVLATGRRHHGRTFSVQRTPLNATLCH